MTANTTPIPRPTYTAEEIYSHADRLPGFAKEGDIFDIFAGLGAQNTLWQPVFSTTIVTRLDRGLEVLTAKRTAEGNATHVNVVSTPTIRLSPQEPELLLAERVPFCLDGNIDPLHPFLSKSLFPSVTNVPDNVDMLASKVSHLLSLKLRLGPALEGSRQVMGRASLARCIAGFSYIDDNAAGEPMYEPLIMFGVIVGLGPQIARQIPDHTGPYSNVGWTPVEQYVHGVRTKNLLEVMPMADPKDELEVCVRGLCNTTSSTILTDSNEV